MKVVTFGFSAADVQLKYVPQADIDLLGVAFGSLIASLNPTLTYTGYFAQLGVDDSQVIAVFYPNFRMRIFAGETLYVVGGGVGLGQLVFDDPLPILS
jgi:hypothetical protein